MLGRGEFGARVGVPRVLDLLDSHGLDATFFVPGHTVESYPAETASILEAGHEIAHHSYAHIDRAVRAATRRPPTWTGRSRRWRRSA